jgi:hypothetical protein
VKVFFIGFIGASAMSDTLCPSVDVSDALKRLFLIETVLDLRTDRACRAVLLHVVRRGEVVATLADISAAVGYSVSSTRTAIFHLLDDGLLVGDWLGRNGPRRPGRLAVDVRRLVERPRRRFPAADAAGCGRGSVGSADAAVSGLRASVRPA